MPKRVIVIRDLHPPPPPPAPLPPAALTEDEKKILLLRASVRSGAPLSEDEKKKVLEDAAKRKANCAARKAHFLGVEEAEKKKKEGEKKKKEAEKKKKEGEKKKALVDQFGAGWFPYNKRKKAPEDAALPFARAQQQQQQQQQHILHKAQPAPPFAQSQQLHEEEAARARNPKRALEEAIQQQDVLHEAAKTQSAAAQKNYERRLAAKEAKRQKRLNNPDIRKKERDCMRERRSDEEYQVTEQERNRDRMREMRSDEEYQATEQERNRNRMRERRSDEEYRNEEQQQQQQYREQNRWKKRAYDRKRYQTEEFKEQDRKTREEKREIRRLRCLRRRQDQEALARDAEVRAARQERRRNAEFSTVGALGLQCNMDTINVMSLGVELKYFGKPTVMCCYCGAMGWEAEDMKQSNGARSHFGKQCCMKGKYGNFFTSFRNPSGHVGQHLPEVPLLLKQLLFGEGRLCKYFRANIRSINSAMALGAVKMDDRSVRGTGPSTLTIAGQLMRTFGSLLKPTSDKEPTCAQIHFYDPNDQVEIRLRRLNGVSTRNRAFDRQLFTALLRMLRQFNALVRQFITVHEYINENSLNPEELRIQLHESDVLPSQPGDHAGRYHIPTVNEVALLMPNHIPPNAERSIVCQVRGANTRSSLVTFPHTHGRWDPCGYPLLFPFGTTTYYQGYKTSHMNEDGDRVPHDLTLNQWFRHMTRWRDDKSESFGYPPGYDEESDYLNCLHHSGRLWQQYIVDTWAKVELNRLIYNRTHQAELRADLYKGVQDTLNKGDGDVSNSGRAVILPATFTCSQRWYHNKFQDAMALCREFGKPTFFLTITLDPKCREVMEQLKGEKNPYDRPDVLCRVFQMKKNAIMKEIKLGLFGPLIAHSAVIEFQKRG